VAGDLRLREVVDADLETFFAQQCEPEAVWMAAFTVRDPADRTAFTAHWNRIRNDPGVAIRTIVWHGRIAGHVARYPGAAGQPEVTYWIGREFWGRGIARAALRAFIRSVAPMRPLAARVAADNAASIRVLEGCGFVRRGEERGYANGRGAEIHEFLYELDAPAEGRTTPGGTTAG
jgi:RimJ/RimL family protein N-acetyltransferase